MRLTVSSFLLTLLFPSSLVTVAQQLRAGRSEEAIVEDDLVQDQPTDYSVHRELTRAYSPLQCNNEILSDDVCLESTTSFLTLIEGHGTSTDPLVVPCGKCVTVDVTDGRTLTLPYGLDIVGRLHFPPTANLILNTTAVFVQGQLDMTEPNEGNTVTLSLFGVEEQYLYPYEKCAGQMYQETCDERQTMGTKPIVVAGGKLNIQARDVDCPSWTLLIYKNSNTELQVDAEFASCAKAGDELLVTSPSARWYDEEVRTISSVDTTNGVITLTAEIGSTLPGLNGPGEPEFAVEVATLSRSVLFEAQDDNPRNEIGGHLIVYHTPDVPQLLSGVHFRNFGQGGILGRYPVHFHLSGTSPSTISGNVVSKSNQRCYVIHETNSVTVANNVAYSTKGHCYITENGQEKYNIFADNLGARTEKLDFDNGQSDSNGGTASTFWIRNMQNEFYGNVAAGSQSIGWWFEFPNRSAPIMLSTEPSSFRDNVAHSIGKNGMTTYKKGYFPSEPAVFDNIRIYKCVGESGWKSHFTGLLTIKNSLFADNKVSVRYGVKNEGIILEDTDFIGLSQDMIIRYGQNCPVTRSAGVYASFNVYPNANRQRAIMLKNVVMDRFICNSRAILPYFDSRRPQGYKEGMGDPIQANVIITNSNDSVKPYVSCGDNEKYFHLEDFGTDPGFVVRNQAHMKAFLPSDACEPMLYGSTWSDGTACNAFCSNVCLRMFHITPSSFDQATKLVLTKGDVSQSFDLVWETFRVVVPSGSYNAQFFDAANNEVLDNSPSIATFQAPQCTDYADISSFVFTTEQPTEQSTSPLTDPPTHGGPAKNLALKKPASQKCNYGSRYPASNGVDGITTARRRFITHTCKTRKAWWRVDLQGMKEINLVKIWNRPDCCQFRLSNFYVKFLDNNGALVNQLYHPGALGLTETLDLEENVIARYVQLELTSTKRDVMSVLEVQVMGWDL